MIVSEVIARLQTMPPNSLVVIRKGAYGDALRIIDIDKRWEKSQTLASRDTKEVDEPSTQVVVLEAY